VELPIVIASKKNQNHVRMSLPADFAFKTEGIIYYIGNPQLHARDKEAWLNQAYLSR